MSKVWAISTSALPAAACKTIWARWSKRAARGRLRAKRAKSSCGSVVNHTLGALGMLIFNAQCASGCSYAAAVSARGRGSRRSTRALPPTPFELPAEVHALAHRIDPQLGNMRDPLFAMDHEGERPEGVTLAVGTVAGRLAATAVSEGERAGKGVGREIETGDKLPFAPPKTVGGRAGG